MPATDKTPISALEERILGDLVEEHPRLAQAASQIAEVHRLLIRVLEHGGRLYTCGNGGSYADALHICGELAKSFERRRPLPADERERLLELPCGQALAEHLEAGLPAIPLGANPALRTAVENDSRLPGMAFAQEACALVRPGDALLAISTSGRAENCLMAMSVARIRRAHTVVLTGPDGGPMAAAADLAVKAPGSSTRAVQEAHVILYHTLCAMLEAHWFPEPR